MYKDLVTQLTKDSNDAFVLLGFVITAIEGLLL